MGFKWKSFDFRQGFWLLLALNVVLIAVAVVWMIAFQHNLDVVTDGAPVCLTDYRDYDGIASAQMIGRFDMVSFLLAFLGLLLAVFAFFGFSAVRRDVVEKAETVAAEKAADIAQKYYGDENEKRTNGVENSTAAANVEYTQSSARDPSEVSTQGAEQETEDKDGKP